MIRFIKDNSYTILKMFINQIGMTVFGLLLNVATYTSNLLTVLTSVFAILFYMVLLYSMTWDEGLRDKAKIDAGRLPFKPFKGLFLSLAANSLNLLLAISLHIGYFFITDMENSFPAWAANIYVISKAIATFLQGMYIGLISSYSPNNPIAYLLIILPAIFVCWIAYIAGAKDFRIASLFGISPSGTKKKK